MALTRPKIGQIYTNVTALTDAITVLHAGANQANVDVGFLVNRAHGLVPNAAFYYSETLDTFVTAFTNNTGGTDSNILVTNYADFTAGNVYTTGLYWTGNGQPISFATGGGSGNITVRSLFSGNLQPNVVVTNINAIEFDEESGFDIQNRGSGNVLVAMNSTFKYWEVTGSDQLVASGLDHITIDSGNNIVITSNASATPYKSIRFSVSDNPNFVGNVTASGNIVGGGVRTTTSATPPPTPTPGDIWYNTNRDTILRYTDVGSSRYWIDINGPTLFTSNVGYSNVNVSAYLSGNITTGNISATGYYFANGTPFVSGSNYGNTQVAAYLLGNITTGNVSATGYYFANGTPFISGSNYGNTEVSAYLLTNTGNIAAGNINVTGNIVGGGVRTTTGPTKPTNPTVGDIWYNTSSDVLFRYTDTGSEKHWLDISGSYFEILSNNNITAGNLYATAYFFANGAPFTSSNYGNANVASYLTGNITIGNVTATAANLGSVGNLTITGGSADYVLSTDGSGHLSWVEMVGGLSSTEATGNVTMVTNYRYICDTTTTSITLTLPASAVIGDEVGVLDGTGNCNVHNITVARNGHKIQGLAEDLTVSTSRAAFTLVYYNVSQGWLLTQV